MPSASSMVSSNVQSLEDPSRPADHAITHESGTSSGDDGTALSFLVHGSAYIPMFDVITQYLEPRDIIALRGVDRALAANDVFSAAQSSQWNIDTALSEFFKSPVGFRSALGQVQAVVTGEFVLRFLDRRAPGERIDIFMSEEEPNKETLTAFLQNEGYDQHGGHTHQAPARNRLWTGVDRYVRKRPTGVHPTKLYVKYTVGPPVVSILKGMQYTTALANVITATKAYVPFAEYTIKERRSYLHGMLHDSDEEMPAALSVASESGRDLRDHIVAASSIHGSTEKPTPARCYRTLADGKTWVIPFPTDGLVTPKEPDFVIEATDFSVRVDTNDAPGHDRFIVALDALDFVGLQYSWAGLQLRSVEVMRRLRYLLMLEIGKLPKEDWPVDLMDFMFRGLHSRSGDFVPPTWLDDMVAEWAGKIAEGKQVP
ncbi:hypothetical protein BU16DRAFT_554033 [Lophium mytilinum]|uniref:Uncharacterized protein n=1 Tax=Lophium mytilinum TaxID=390894 RepID=A0A6A6RBY1_9PEZI|nr:hypothetical protein BU16DRAFT_554033 [Lophium mytilinum]